MGRPGVAVLTPGRQEFPSHAFVNISQFNHHRAPIRKVDLLASCSSSQLEAKLLPQGCLPDLRDQAISPTRCNPSFLCLRGLALTTTVIN